MKISMRKSNLKKMGLGGNLGNLYESPRFNDGSRSRSAWGKHTCRKDSKAYKPWQYQKWGRMPLAKFCLDRSLDEEHFEMTMHYVDMFQIHPSEESRRQYVYPKAFWEDYNNPVTFDEDIDYWSLTEEELQGDGMVDDWDLYESWEEGRFVEALDPEFLRIKGGEVEV